MTARDLASIYEVSTGTIAAWRRAGVLVESAPAVLAYVRTLRRPPSAWRESLVGLSEEETLESLKKRKIKAEARRHELAADREQGRLIPLADAERIGILWSDTLKTSLAAMSRELAQRVAGYDEAQLEAAFDETHRRLLEEMADLDSEAWRQTLEREESSKGKRLSGGSGS